LAVKRASARFIGSENFRAEMEQRHQELLAGGGRREDASFRRPTGRVSREAVVSSVSHVLGKSGEELRRRQKGQMERCLLAQALTRHAGLTQREVAAELGLSTGAAVSLQLRSLREALVEDKTLRRHLQAIDSRLLSFKG
jgi:hypothetical protein